MNADNHPHRKRSAYPDLPLPRPFYDYTALEAAPRLLGQHLIRRTEAGDIVCRIVETESYGGIEDKGSHAYGGRRTARTEIMFKAGGAAYIYLIYGMHYCLNVVTAEPDNPQAVLIRGVQPLTPVDAEYMAANRNIKIKRPSDLSGGPGKLCRALRIDKSLNGTRLDAPGGALWLEQGDDPVSLDIVQSPRINIPYAEEYVSQPWRFYIKDNPYISVKEKNEQAFTWT
ncbi:DNA-3-methyladenine glycosylase [Paenibacillus wynnii]|uniref:DNA-3-methyladenine glycosylase n=1 Tax=Paenibacillus wynnii TaxID=268407 RepID=UPI002794A2A5|nr:DNA-3-methyladenine glycosylase [Paenibacillus wynnii]MDQ0196409.1 DNA-3-methyladenine glycosylase [Paenibacillus wynnii]